MVKKCSFWANLYKYMAVKTLIESWFIYKPSAAFSPLNPQFALFLVRQAPFSWRYTRRVVPSRRSAAWPDRSTPQGCTLTTPTTAATRIFATPPGLLVPSAWEERCSACCLHSASCWSEQNHQNHGPPLPPNASLEKNGWDVKGKLSLSSSQVAPSVLFVIQQLF